MTRKLFWLDDLQWASIKPYVPSRKQRGPRRQDDRRVVSGIVHVLQAVADGRTVRQSMVPQRRYIIAFIAGHRKAYGNGCF